MPIYQMKNKTKCTKDGRTWYFRCYYTDIYGKRKQKVSKLYKTKIEAKEAEVEFLSKIRIIDDTDKNIKFEDVYVEWLEFKKRQIKTATYYSYKKCFDKNILTFFKKYKLHSIKMNTINDFYVFLEKQEVTIKYQNIIIGHLKEILIYARENFEFDPKIVSRIQKRRDEFVYNSQRDAEWNFWNFKEFNKFIECVDDKDYKLYFTFLYFTGLRFGEFAALNWHDINFEKKTLSISKTLTNKLGTGTYNIFEPKTKNSIRIIDIDDQLVEMLWNHYESEKEMYGFNNDMFIFGNIAPISSSTFRRNLNKYIEISKVKKITIHGFRHSHVSLLYDLGCDSYDVAARIGDTISIVEKTYYHMFDERKSNTVNALNNLKMRGNQDVKYEKDKKTVDIQRF